MTNNNLEEVLKTLKVQQNTSDGLAICATYGRKFNCIEFSTREDVAQPVLISPWMQFEPSEMSDLRQQLATEITRRAINYPRVLQEIDSLQKRLSSVYDLIDDKTIVEQKIYETWGKERATYGLKQDFMDIENSQWPKELMGDYRSNNGWKPLESAPKDGTRILFGGKWKPHTQLKGDKEIRIFSWNTIRDYPFDEVDFKWFTDDWFTPEDISVDWTHWKLLPEFYV